MNPLYDHDELKDAPVLRSIPKTDPFVMPEGFFERFPQQVQDRIGTSGGRVIDLDERRAQQRLLVRFATAAAVVALIATVAIGYLRNDGAMNADPITEISVAPGEIDLDAMDDHELFALLGDDHEPFAQAGDGLSTDEMAAYLEHEELPLDLLIEEL